MDAVDKVCLERWDFSVRCAQTNNNRLLSLILAAFNLNVPDVEAGCCLGPEGNGVSSGEGG
jgi:hypothetical protein